MRYIKRIYYILLIVGIYIPNLFASPLSSSNYTISMPHISSGGGYASSLNYSIELASVGEVFGGISKSPSYLLHAGYFYVKKIVSVVVDPPNWPLGLVGAGKFKITGPEERISIKNNGNIKEDYTFQVIDATNMNVAEPWNAADTVGGSGINKYVMSGVLTDMIATSISEGDFGYEDLITESPKALKNGTRIKPKEKRALWLKFDAPRTDTSAVGERPTGHTEHKLSIFINAEEVK